MKRAQRSIKSRGAIVGLVAGVVGLLAGSTTAAAATVEAAAGPSGFAAIDAVVGTVLSLSGLTLAAVFGSRWLTARRR